MKLIQEQIQKIKKISQPILSDDLIRATFEIDIERKKIVTNLFSKATWDLTDERNTQFTNDTFVFMHLMIYLFERIEFPIRQIYILFETET